MSVQAANYVFRACALQDPTCRAVLGALAWQSRQETPHLAYMRHADLMENSGLRSENGLKAALRRLQDAGEVAVVKVGGRVAGFGAMACEYELLKVQPWIAAGEPERHARKVSDDDAKVSVYEPKVSVCDVKVSVCEQKRPLTDTHRQDTTKDTKTISAIAPAPATSSPSLPSSHPKKQRVKFDPTTLPLPHRSSGFASTWADWCEHRRQKRSPLTETGAKRLLKQLGKFSEQQAIAKMDRAMANSWTGCIFPQDLEELKKVVPMVPQRTRSDDWYEALEKRVGGIKA